MASKDEDKLHALLPDDEGEIVPAGRGEILLYQSEDGRTRVECRYHDETIWLSQAMMAELCQTSKQNISLHLQNLYGEGELDANRVVKEYLTTGPDGKKYGVLHYNLDAILAGGYRVRSQRGTQFRRWATERLSGPVYPPGQLHPSVRRGVAVCGQGVRSGLPATPGGRSRLTM